MRDNKSVAEARPPSAGGRMQGERFYTHVASKHLAVEIPMKEIHLQQRVDSLQKNRAVKSVRAYMLADNKDECKEAQIMGRWL